MRYICVVLALEEGNSDHDPPKILRHAPTLQSLAATCVAHQLLQLLPEVVNSMSMLSSEAAMQVINVLKSQKALNPKMMHLFLPWLVI